MEANTEVSELAIQSVHIFLVANFPRQLSSSLSLQQAQVEASAVSDFECIARGFSDREDASVCLIKQVGSGHGWIGRGAVDRMHDQVN